MTSYDGSSLPLGHTTATRYPAATRAWHSSHTRRSKGTGRFWTMMSSLVRSFLGSTPYMSTLRRALIPDLAMHSGTPVLRGGVDREPADRERLGLAASRADLEAIAEGGQVGAMRQVPVGLQPGEHREDVHGGGLLTRAGELPDEFRVVLAQVPVLHRNPA